MRVDPSLTIANQVKMIKTLWCPRFQQWCMSIPCYPGEEHLQCAQKQIMDKLVHSWDNFAICFDQLMSLSEHEKKRSL